MAAAPAGSAADAQARFGRSVKGLLIDRVTGCGTDVIALTKQLLGHAARNMVMQEDAILHSEDSLRKMAIITTHLQYQQEAIQKKSWVFILVSWPSSYLKLHHHASSIHQIFRTS
ncbi:BLOC-1-related complex subunit 7 isoform X2 [Chrysemys picta bellii]|uniref:BLOC-1-related complex subunit 7 isoform X2 n=1 Tax=Chrysemys picta bellii TaxID=8478 RepID=UPI0032B1F846